MKQRIPNVPVSEANCHSSITSAALQHFHTDTECCLDTPKCVEEKSEKRVRLMGGAQAQGRRRCQPA